MNQEQWIRVDPGAMNRRHHHKVDDGVEVVWSTSPYDIPEAMRSSYDREKRRLTIEFRYMSEESTRREQHGPYLSLGVGKNSGRIYTIEIDMHAVLDEWVKLSIKAISERAKQRSEFHRSNYEVTKRLLREHAPELSAAMAAG